MNLVKEGFDDLFMNFLKKTGIKSDIIRMYSTQISSNIKRLTRIELLSRTLKKFLNTLSDEGLKLYSEECEIYMDEDKRKENLREITAAKKSLEMFAKDILKILKPYENPS